MEKSGEDLQVEFNLIIATVPHKVTNHIPEICYGKFGSSLGKKMMRIVFLRT